jgi:hypothetical protein
MDNRNLMTKEWFYPSALKTALKAIGFLGEIYLETMEYDSARECIEYWMRRASEKSEEELSTFITLWKYYLKLNREEDVLNLIATLTEHEKLDEEAVAIVLSTAIKYGKFEEGALFGRSVFKWGRSGIWKEAREGERWVILFFEWVLWVLQSHNNSQITDSPLSQGILLYIENSLPSILSICPLTSSVHKPMWDLIKTSFKLSMYSLTKSLSSSLLSLISDDSSITYLNAVQAYIEASFKLDDLSSVREYLDKLPVDANSVYLRVKYALIRGEEFQKLLEMLNKLVSVENFHMGYIVLLLYDTQEVECNGKEVLAEFMMNYLLLEDIYLDKLQEVIEKNRGMREANGEKRNLTFLSIFINLYHYCGKEKEQRYLWSIIPVVNSFVERVLNVEEADSDKMLRWFALWEEAIWLLGFLWNEGYSLLEKNPNVSVKYLRTAANLALLSVKLIDLNQEKQKEISVMGDQQKEIEFLKKKYLYFYNAACALLTSCTVHFKQLKKSCENSELFESVIKEIDNMIVPKIRQWIQIIDTNILSQSQLNKISFALEIRTQKWHKDLLQESKEIHKTAYLLLVDTAAFTKSSKISSILSEFQNLKNHHPLHTLLSPTIAILSSYNLSEPQVSALSHLTTHLSPLISTSPSLLPLLLHSYESLINLTSHSSPQSAKTHMKSMAKHLENCPKLAILDDKSDNTSIEKAYLYLISKAWNLGVDEYDSERDENAKEFFSIADAVVGIAKDVLDRVGANEGYQLRAYLDKWSESIRKAADVFRWDQ